METKPIATLTLPEPWPSRVRGGIPLVDGGELGAEVKSLGAGEAVLLRAENFEPIGLGIHDPETGGIWAMPSDDEEVIDEGFFRRRVRLALAFRSRLSLHGDAAAYRLINAEGDGLPGFQVDWYAGYIVIHALSAALDPWSTVLARALAEELKPKGVISKIRPAGEVPTGKIPFRLEAGEAPPPAVNVLEDGITYEVHLTGGLNTGFFADMREVRRSLAPWLKGMNVLNTFSYSGSFSVLAAVAGAKSVTSVDFAAGVLEWSKTNFRCNDLDPNRRYFHFERDDVFEFLKKAKRQERVYDVVILDPPATTTVPGRRWFLKSDYHRLISHALRVAARPAMLVVAASCHASRPEKIESQIRESARETNRRLRLVASIGLPADFPTQMIHPAARYLKCFVLAVD